jgi:glycosyltransferase involved in cell wall biosynthesis
MFQAVAVSVVIIGRNEGQRLENCIRSVQSADWNAVVHEVLYIDSRSTDASVALAQSHGVSTLVLPEGPMCAAKARNLGWTSAQGEFILFLDGDTVLHPDFVHKALLALQDSEICAAWGHRRESNPGQSFYTRVLDLDWIYPTGITPYFGGDVLVRRSALMQVEGFDASLNAGEEPELCARLRAVGWKIMHIDAPMTQHDLAVRTLKAYARRCYRSGIAYAEVAHRMKILGDSLWQAEARRDFAHGLIYLCAPAALVSLLFVHVLAGMALCAAGTAVVLRSAWRCRQRASGSLPLALGYAIHSHIQKVPALFGQFAWKLAQLRSQRLGLVNYKE